MVVILYVSGALRSIGFTAYNSLAFSDVHADDLTHANTLNASVHELAAGLGVAVAALALSVLTPLATGSGHGAKRRTPGLSGARGADGRDDR